MNATVKASRKTAFHTVANAEFTAVYDRKVHDFPNNHGENRIRSTGNYHLFIRYGDKVYMEVKGVGEIVMPYDTLQKNKYLNYYYNLSHKLTYDKHLVYQHLLYSCDWHIRYQINDYAVYPDEERWWGISTAFLETTIDTRVAKIVDNETIWFMKISQLVNLKEDKWLEWLHEFSFKGEQVSKQVLIRAMQRNQASLFDQYAKWLF